MVYVLKEHFALKIDKSGQGELYVECIRNASASFAEVGNVAYPHDPTIVTRPLDLTRRTHNQTGKHLKLFVKSAS